MANTNFKYLGDPENAGFTEDALYILSQNIKVFPCAYRGYYGAGDDARVFDPESRATTEANFTEAFHKVSTNKHSYVVDWVPEDPGKPEETGTLKCVIGGYYFEITNQKMADFFYEDYAEEDLSKNNPLLMPYKLCIRTEAETLSSSPEDGTRKTKLLKSFKEDGDNYLDIRTAAAPAGVYVFTGLAVKQAVDATITASLEPFSAIRTYEKAITGTSETEYYKSGNNYIKITAQTPAPAGSDTYVRVDTYSINPRELPITSVLDVAEGKYSLRMLAKENSTYTTQATGDFAVALGKSTSAQGEASLAVGDNTSAEDKGTVALGNNTIARAVGAVALGSNTIATSANQVVIGKYNYPDAQQAFIVANGTTNGSATANKFTVSYNGDINTLGKLTVTGNHATKLGGTLTVNGNAELKNLTVKGATTLNSTLTVADDKATTLGGTLTVKKATAIEDILTTKGSITASGSTENKLTLGSEASGSYGSIVVYGETSGNTPVFEVKETGELKTASNATVEGDAEIKDALTVNGLTTLKNTVFLEQGAGIIGNVTVSGKISSNSTLAEDEETTLTTKKYVDQKCAAILQQCGDNLTNAFQETTETTTIATAGNGKYVQAITQVDGKIKTSEGQFTQAVSTESTTTAPCNKAVANHVATVLSTIWSNNQLQAVPGAMELSSLKEIILNATYPIGSIYSMYKEGRVDTCPIADTLGGTWERIEVGRFLCSASPDTGGIYQYAWKGGSANAIIPTHEHTINSKDVTISSSGAHTHSVTKKGTAHDGGSDDTFRTAQSNKSGAKNITWSIPSGGSHTHSFTLSGMTTANAEGGEDVTNKNLPPYLAVYMWKRTA